MANVVPGDNSGNPDWRLIMISNLISALSPTLYCRSWIPWFRTMAMAAVAVIVLVIWVILVRTAGLPALLG